MTVTTTSALYPVVAPNLPVGAAPVVTERVPVVAGLVRAPVVAGLVRAPVVDGVRAPVVICAAPVVAGGTPVVPNESVVQHQ